MDSAMGSNNPQQQPKNPFLEAVKEFLRNVVMGMLAEVAVVIIPIIIAGINTTTGVIMINWQLIYAVGLVTFLTAVLRGLDKWKHEQSKLENPEDQGKSMGILPF